MRAPAADGVPCRAHAERACAHRIARRSTRASAATSCLPVFCCLRAQASAVRARARSGMNHERALPGGLIRLWMCPPFDSTNVLRAPPYKRRRPIDALPRRDVIGEAADDVRSRCRSGARSMAVPPRTRSLPGLREAVRREESKKIGMQLRRQPRRVVVPEQDVVGRRIVAQQVVVDDVVPDQIVRPHPREHPREARCLRRRRVCCDAAFAALILAGVTNSPAVALRDRRRVEHADRQRRGVDYLRARRAAR